MNSHWTELELGDFIELKRGYDLPKSKRVPGKFEIISSAGVTDYHNESKVKGPSVITGRYGTIGEVFYTEDDYWPLNTTLYVKDFKGNDPLFVYYLLHTINYLEYSDKAAVPGVNRNHLHKAVIKVPSDVASQKSIAQYLKLLDRKIALNCRLNESLEQIAQAIFKSWFVDFEPTKAKIAARKALLAENPDATPEQISTAEQQAAIQVIAGAGDVIPTEQLQIIADLFPNQQVDSELGEIPYGWSYCGAQELFNISIGKTPPRKESHWFSNNPTDIKWISIKDLGNSGTYVKTCSEYLTEEAVTKHKVKKAEKDTVLLSFKLTVGRVAIAAHDMCTNEAIAHFNVSDLSPPSTWTYSYLKQYDYESLGSTSSIATAINSKIIKGMPFLKSANELNSHWSEVTKPLFDALYNNTMMVDTLEKLRNELLPKLLSGDLAYEDNGVV